MNLFYRMDSRDFVLMSHIFAKVFLVALQVPCNSSLNVLCVSDEEMQK